MKNEENKVPETVEAKPIQKAYVAPVYRKLNRYRSYDQARDAGYAGPAYRERCREDAFEDAQRC